jgi:hypothetical protein
MCCFLSEFFGENSVDKYVILYLKSSDMSIMSVSVCGKVKFLKGKCLPA